MSSRGDRWKGGFSVQLRDADLKRAIKDVRHWSSKKKRAVRDVISEYAINVQRSAKERVPTDMGALKNSIAISYDGNGMGAGVSTTMEYAWFVEMGRDPGKMPPVEVIEDWARRHGMEGAGFAIARNIAVEGTEAQPFMHPAAEENRRPYKLAMREALATP